MHLHSCYVNDLALNHSFVYFTLKDEASIISSLIGMCKNQELCWHFEVIIKLQQQQEIEIS